MVSEKFIQQAIERNWKKNPDAPIFDKQSELYRDIHRQLDTIIPMNITIELPDWDFVTIILIWAAIVTIVLIWAGYVVLSFVDLHLKHNLEKTKKWVSVDDDFPEIGQPVTVQTISGQIFHAIYRNEDEFDVHRPEFDLSSHSYRSDWYKYSSRTIVRWKPLAPA